MQVRYQAALRPDSAAHASGVERLELYPKRLKCQRLSQMFAEPLQLRDQCLNLNPLLL